MTAKKDTAAKAAKPAARKKPAPKKTADPVAALTKRMKQLEERMTGLEQRIGASLGWPVEE